MRTQARALRRLREAQALHRAEPEHPDTEIIRTCAAYAVIRARFEKLTSSNGWTDDKPPRAEAYAAIWNAGRPLLHALIDLRPATPSGHALRAAAFLTYDEGDLLRAAQPVARIEDRLLTAIVVDLAMSGME